MSNAVAPVALSAVAASAAGEGATVFCYGTLMADEVLRALLGRHVRSCAAEIRHYRRYSIRRRSYPAVIPFTDATVRGKLLFGLTPTEMDLFDDFEDEEYERRVVTALPLAHDDNSNLPSDVADPPIHAYLYVWKHITDPDLGGDWDYESWRHQCLSGYAPMCSEFASEWRQGHGLPPGAGAGARAELQAEQQGLQAP